MKIGEFEMDENIGMIATSRRAIVGLVTGMYASALAVKPARAAKLSNSPSAAGTQVQQPTVHYRTASLDGLDIFYREAGPQDAPVVLLLHGFPTSSRMYRTLIPMLADQFRVIAPDHPAFGHSATPPRTAFDYTHAHLSEVIDALLVKLGVESFSMYVMDFGGPIGYRLMLKYPNRVSAIVAQNTPVFGEPTNSPARATLLAYWKDGSPENRQKARRNLTPAAVRNQYLAATRDRSLLDPDSWTIDSALLARPGVDDIMLDLLYDIRNNVQTVAGARQFFGAHQQKLMIVTGVNDPIFPGASMQPPPDMRQIEFHGVDSGHFALEDKYQEIGNLTRNFLVRSVPT
jgi:pimeloyl-ACP methyl ester carboxylesterase